MSVKEEVLEIFENNVGKNISGEEMAKKIGVSRNAVWKAVVQLKNQGYSILSQIKNGYTFSPDNDLFRAGYIKKHININCDVLMFDEKDSSNTVAKELAVRGAKEGTVVIVKRQTSGRGRMGRTFISDSENGLYMSIILRPAVPVSASVNITVLGAVAVAEAIEETSGYECKIKWVNDIYISDKKVCGILTEAAMNFESGMPDYAVIGIGINVSPPPYGFPDEIREIAGSIYESNAPNGYKSRLAALITDKFFKYYGQTEKKEYIKTYKEKSNIIGKRINVYIGNEIITGIAVDIDNDANLIVDTGKEIKKFNSGEVRILRNVL